MPTWGLVATVKAPEEEVLAFVAHHLALGASWLWVYFDDPDDPAFNRISKLPHVTATRCTSWYWLTRGGRNSQIIHRQIRNARDAQRQCRLDWLGHIDVDEFLHAPRQVAEVLADMPTTSPSLLMEPFEALHDPELADDIFTARHFRGPLQEDHRQLHGPVFGAYAPILSKGGLSHVLGKSFCRPKSPGLQIGLHNVTVNKQKRTISFHPTLRLLHFHAQDPAAWRRVLPFRLQHGAYEFPEETDLRNFLKSASDAQIADFYTTSMTLTAEKLDLLNAHDRLVTADLGLRAKVSDLLAGRLG